MLRILLVGCGYIAQAEHLPNWRQLPGVELVGVVDNREELAEQVAAGYGIRSFSSLEDALEAVECDAVHVCTPPWTHQDLVESAAAAKLHILVEKPFTDSADAASAALTAVESAGVKLVVGYPRIFDADVSFLTRMIRDGSMGRLLGLQSVFKYSDDPVYPRFGSFPRTLPSLPPDGSSHELRWRLLDESVHHLNLFGTWTRAPLRVRSTHGCGHLWQITLQSAEGTPASHFNAGTSGQGEEIWAYLEGGSVYVRPWSPHFPATYGTVIVRRSHADATEHPVLPRRNPYLVMLDYFVELLTTDLEWKPAAWQAVADLELIESIVAFYESIGERKN